MGLDNGTTVKVPVEWTCKNYDAKVPGKYVFEGILVMSEGIENPDGLTAKAEVTVLKKSEDVTNPDKPGTTPGGNSGNSTGNSTGSGAVKTGDNSGLVLWISMAVFALVSIVGVYFRKKKR